MLLTQSSEQESFFSQIAPLSIYLRFLRRADLQIWLETRKTSFKIFMVGPLQSFPAFKQNRE